MIVESFNFSANSRARVLILGSMPGVESLRRQQYYAHPRNAFWDIMNELFGAGRELAYVRRLARLRARGIALWDVAQQCFRPGSLDARIQTASVVANDFPALFARCPHIHSVFFNGRTAENLYHRLVWPQLTQPQQMLDYTALPSTSPANASLNKAQKLAQWRAVTRGL
ncbi:MAG TPA: DNA-deoxyinosine glycosylase [Gammaproteobacteria bacterium]|nr:DNA-deoxyinosine glycosylase [Gammaproteobacteria bacterium]